MSIVESHNIHPEYQRGGCLDWAVVFTTLGLLGVKTAQFSYRQTREIQGKDELGNFQIDDHTSGVFYDRRLTLHLWGRHKDKGYYLNLED